MGVLELLNRVREMFVEVPGTRLSLAQVARLAGLELSVCRETLKALTDSHVLKAGPDGSFTLQ
jgi:DNA-binding IclR family transcriptional regulator